VLDAALAPDGAVTRLVGEHRVVMSFPGAADAPARSVESDRLDASGSAGQSLTSARFSGNVSFREGAVGAGSARAARARALSLEMSDEAISSAVFTGGATFEEDDLTAVGEEARYEPGKGRLRLNGAGADRLPLVADERLRVEAESIEIELERRALEARGRVKALLRPESRGSSGRNRRAGSTQPARLPGLLAPDQAVTVTAARLVHDGDGGTARFSGNVWLWQGETEIRAGAVDVDQQKGDLVATGDARSVLEFESGRSDGRAHQIRYTDDSRLIAYTAAPAGAQQAGETRPRLKGPQGDLAAARIDIVLAKTESRVERIEGYDAVTAQVDAKTIRGHRFTYQQARDRYEVTGSSEAPLSVRTESCRENSGSTLTFERSTDTMTIDGRTVRTLTKNTCREPASH
jgi:lipopolysaccharide export system protein LptA